MVSISNPFRSRTKTHVGNATMRIVEDDAIPNPVQRGVIGSIFRQHPLAESINQEILMGGYRGFEAMYRYAEKGDYAHGLPNARIMTSEDGYDLVKEAIESEVAATVELVYAFFRPLNHIHEARRVLMDEFGYDPVTNRVLGLEEQMGSEVHVSNIVPTYHETEENPSNQMTRGYYGRNPNANKRAGNGYSGDADVLDLVLDVDEIRGVDETDGAHVTYTWLEEDADGNPVRKEDTYFVDLTGNSTEAGYYQVLFRQGTALYYWTYGPDDGTHPDLDGLYDLTYTTAGTYFPFAMFRSNSVNMSHETMEGIPEFETTKKLLDYISIDFEEFGEEIHENPDVGDVEQAVLMMAVPMNTTHDIEKEYLYRFFRRLSVNLPFLQSERIGREAIKSPGVMPAYALEIANADFRMILGFERLQRKLIEGEVAPGAAVNTVILNTGVSVVFPELVMGDTTFGEIAHNAWTIRKQITPRMYEELVVVNLELKYDIAPEVDKHVRAIADDDALLIPLDRDLLQGMSILDREELYYRSLHMVFNSKVEETIRPYQESGFVKILEGVAIIMTIVTLGKTAKSIALASSLAAAAKATAIIILQSVAFTFTFNLLAELLGPEFALAVAVIAAAVGMGRSFAAGEGFAFGQDIWAERLLRVANGLQQGVQNVLGTLYAEFQSDVEEFQLLQEEKWAELEEAQELLSNTDLLDPFMFVGEQPMTLFGESPGDFFQRTVESGNVGVKGIESVEQFVASALRLPTLEDTLEA